MAVDKAPTSRGFQSLNFAQDESNFSFRYKLRLLTLLEANTCFKVSRKPVFLIVLDILFFYVKKSCIQPKGFMY